MTTPSPVELADRCKQCRNLVEPAAIGMHPHIAAALALYRCDKCKHCWYASWIDECE